MPKCYQLIGVPGSGKSTWAWSQNWIEGMDYVSTDHHVEVYAKEQGKTYSEVFTDYMPQAVELMAAEVVEARTAGRDIIWDQTSTTLASRARKFNMLPDYWHIAVVFRTPKQEELARRLASRPGKVIPINIVNSMCKNWEEPTLEEGFREIWYV